MIVVQDYWDSPIPDFPVFLVAKEVIDRVLVNDRRCWLGVVEKSFADSDLLSPMFPMPWMQMRWLVMLQLEYNMGML